MGTTIFQPVQPGSVVLRPRLESTAFVHLGSSILHSEPRAPLNTSIYSFACKVAMAVIDAVPSLEELSLVDVCGQQCMPGIETNLAELLLTAAEATPDRVCLEVEGESYTFAQAPPLPPLLAQSFDDDGVVHGTRETGAFGSRSLLSRESSLVVPSCIRAALRCVVCVPSHAGN